MDSLQAPGSAPLVLAAVYQREVGASLARIWENVLDWEHLPWLHARSFVGIELQHASAEGFRARVWLPPADAPRPATIEVQLDQPALRYLTQTVEGLGAGTRIWTRLEPVAERRTRIAVEFHLPATPALREDQLRPVGAYYVQLYTQLWDEDEAMMARRQAVLDARSPRADGPDARAAASSGNVRVALGPVAALRSRLPLVVDGRGGSWRVVAQGDALLVHSAVCPHLGGPLDAAGPDPGGRLTCPWHGYRFDLRTGRSCDGRGLALARAPALAVDGAGEAAPVWGAA